MPEDELERKLALLEAAWQFFDDVAARVSLELEKGPRGGGRNRDEIVRHVLGWERGRPGEEGRRCGGSRRSADAGGAPVPPRGVRRRAAEPTTPRGSMARGRNWTIGLLLRHTAFHVLDHAWEMEDKDLSYQRQSPDCAASRRADRRRPRRSRRLGGG